MDILKLTFENLNSLSGKWAIDFTRPEYRNEGIFAITGPTGAGKSTLLDAICLALYGQTPRLKNVGKTENEIMSRQAGHCRAEVTFRTHTGVYRASFFQNRAHRNPRGNLQDVQREFSQITDMETGAADPLATTLRDVQAMVHEHVGLDFHQFTQAVLLAQGKFAEFLQAPPTQRGSLLEKMTRTEIYSDISKAVYFRFKQEEKEWEKLNAGLEKIHFLTPDELQDHQARQEALTAQHTQMEETRQTLQTQLAWLENLAQLQKTRDEIHASQNNLTESRKAFLPDAQRLKQAQQAAEILPEFQHYQTAIQTHTQIDKELQTETENLETAKAELSQAEKEIHTLDEQLTQTMQDAELPKILPVLNEQLTSWHTLQKALSDRRKSIAQQTSKLQKSETDVAKALAEEKQKDAQNHLATAQKITLENELTQRLAGQTAEAIQAELDTLHQNAMQLEAATQRWSALSEKLTEYARLTDEISATAEKQQQLTPTLAHTQNLITVQEKLVAELDEKLKLIWRLADLQQHRQLLRPGEPCPLCGSTEHPYADPSGVPHADSARLQLTEAQNTLTLHRQKHAADLLETRQAAQRETIFRQMLADTEKKIHADVTALRQNYVVREQPFPVPDAEEPAGNFSPAPSLFALSDASETQQARLTEALTSVQARILSVKKLIADLRAKEREITAAQKEVERCRDEWSRTQNDLNAKIRSRDALHSRLSADSETLAAEERATQALRQTMLAKIKPFFDKTALPETELSMLADEYAQWREILRTLHHRNDARIQATEKRKQAGEKRTVRQITVRHTEEKIQTLADKKTSAAQTLNEAQRKWTATLASAGFSSPQAFLDARLSKNEIQSLEARRDELRDAEKTLEFRRSENEKSLASETEKKLTPHPPDVLREKIAEIKNESEENLRRQGDLREEIRKSLQEQQRYAKEKALSDTQRAQMTRWGDLNSLIGSWDGKKFKDFAQHLTFTSLLRQSNHYLRHMTDRYLLSADENTANMEIMVQDNYQAGAIRTAKNLSGGETFLVSMALALGLAGMAGREVRLDSLFLDEGFGTLDEETLEVALNALGTLQQTGKLIGVISHVQALQERLSTQIAVRRVSAGISELTGPGISRK